MDLSQSPTIILLRPGDRVMVALTDDPDPDEAQGFVEALYEAFPGVEFTVVGGLAGLAVMAGADLKKRRPK